ncbi:MAG: hypothetical protein JST76_00725 [Bacteroidetes bacterium]|nr:hypothetical protein [Bacteroidota bacterium]
MQWCGAPSLHCHISPASAAGIVADSPQRRRYLYILSAAAAVRTISG